MSQKLSDTGFISRWDWQEVDQDGREKDWLLRYYQGKRAKEEIKRFGTGEQLELELPPPKEAEVSTDDPELSTAVSNLAKELVKRGITEVTAKELVRNHSTEEIQRQIEVFDWLKETRSQRIRTNAPGFLRRSIEEDYEPPDEYANQRDREADEQKERERKERWLQYREELIRQDLADWDKTPPEEKVEGVLDAWKFTQSRPNQDMIESKVQELINNLPQTDEEKREYLALNHPEDPPADFD